ncbi:MAG: hypothetical protein ACKV22_01295, partial [Bryobacteraceae bacterium]
MRLRISLPAALFVAAALAPTLCMAQPPGTAPAKIDLTIVLDPADPNVGTSACTFPVQIHVTGKSKTFTLPGNRLIVTAPGQFATVTNLSHTSKEVTLNITGVFTYFNQPDGGFVAIGTGRNLVTDPKFGLTLVVGRFSFAFDG